VNWYLKMAARQTVVERRSRSPDISRANPVSDIRSTRTPASGGPDKSNPKY
jgi:hypothetical protein